MYRNNVNFVISITLLAIIGDGTALKCVEETACTCHLPNGTLYDLNKLSEQSPIKSNNNFNLTFSFQPCKNVKMDMTKDNPTECNRDLGVSLCAQNHTDAEKSFSLGTTGETKWAILESSAELVLTHANYTTRILLVCCDNCNLANLSLASKPEKSEYNLILSSQYACMIHGSHRGLSTGSILVILLLVFGSVYFCVGALALHFLRGAIGWEMIPNYDFWSKIPGHCRDGIAYVFNGCSPTTYERI
ncbi:uncharacterized protein [Venturia canescens]|uniref:uncharacterized protein isoform X2 n=1 Tax=Venturia canescens TaxID=32260 RepID=UPI001C9CE601|nr:uncharacterized protein LOC122409876 isoform X2 [Venturia canescens]